MRFLNGAINFSQVGANDLQSLFVLISRLLKKIIKEVDGEEAMNTELTSLKDQGFSRNEKKANETTIISVTRRNLIPGTCSTLY